jgi:hypothetical protein
VADIPRFAARLEITNGGGTFDSQAPGRLRGDGLDVPRIKFRLRKSLEQTPNTAEIEIFNLGKTTVDLILQRVVKRIEFTPEERAQLAAAGASSTPIEKIYDNLGIAAIRLSYGYVGASPSSPYPPMSVGFIGGSTKMIEEEDDTTSIFRIVAQDAGSLLGAARLDKYYRHGAQTIDILVDLIHACGLSVNRTRLQQALESFVLARGLALSKLTQIGGFNATPHKAGELITNIMKALELRWSVQDGEFLVLDADTVLSGYAPLVLSSEDGSLFGKPTRLEASQMQARTWATPEARPGREAQLAAATLGTQYRIEVQETTADTDEGGSSTLTLDAIQAIPGLF